MKMEIVPVVQQVAVVLVQREIVLTHTDNIYSIVPVRKPRNHFY